MKKIIITEEERKKILKMHESRTKGHYLMKNLNEDNNEPPKEELPVHNEMQKKYVGKTVTFYGNKEDALEAFNSGRNNPAAKKVIVAKIKDIFLVEGGMENEYTDVIIRVDILSNVNPNSPQVSYSTGVDFDPKTGVFYIEKKPTWWTKIFNSVREWYSESLKQSIIKDFYSTDFVSTNQKNNVA